MRDKMSRWEVKFTPELTAAMDAVNLAAENQESDSAVSGALVGKFAELLVGGIYAVKLPLDDREAGLPGNLDAMSA